MKFLSSLLRGHEVFPGLHKSDLQKFGTVQYESTQSKPDRLIIGIPHWHGNGDCLRDLVFDRTKQRQFICHQDEVRWMCAHVLEKVTPERARFFTEGIKTDETSWGDVEKKSVEEAYGFDSELAPLVRPGIIFGRSEIRDRLFKMMWVENWDANNKRECSYNEKAIIHMRSMHGGIRHIAACRHNNLKNVAYGADDNGHELRSTAIHLGRVFGQLHLGSHADQVIHEELSKDFRIRHEHIMLQIAEKTPAEGVAVVILGKGHFRNSDVSQTEFAKGDLFEDLQEEILPNAKLVIVEPKTKISA